MERFEVVVVGAGPAGSAAAYGCAKAGLSTLLIERGKTPGAKNMFGGRIYSYALRDLLPGWRDDCPVERYVVRENLVFLSEGAALNVAFESPRIAAGRAASFTALRGRFDAWLAAKAEEAGAMLVTDIRVDGPWRDGGRVRGVVAGNDKVAADVVVAADGSLSQMARALGLRGDLLPEECSVGVKETIALPSETIQERFALGEEEGAAYVYVGDASDGLRGGGFLYTNKASVSLGLVVSSEDLGRQHKEIGELMERFRLHPHVQRLVKGGKIVEYSAHLVPELGAAMMPRLASDGFLVCGDAAGFLINNGYTFRGVDLAIASGTCAAEAVVEAKAAGDFREARLAAYERRLRERKVLDDLETFSRAPLYMKNRRLFDLYPKLICDIAERVYAVEGTGQKRVADIVLEEVKANKANPLHLLLDLLRGARSM
jgi:electron transfer flavoprotein-quinone oxidoreductase